MKHMKHSPILTQVLLLPLLLLSACQAKPTAVGNPNLPYAPEATFVGNPELPYSAQETPAGNSAAQPSDSVATDVIDGYLTAFQAQDWQKGWAYLRGAPPSAEACGTAFHGFYDINDFISVAQQGIAQKGTLVSWEYEQVRWTYDYKASPGGGEGYYNASVILFRNWSSGYREEDVFYLARNEANYYVICELEELSY